MFPRHTDEVLAALSIAREQGTPPDRAWWRDLDRGQRRRTRRGARLLPVPEPGARGRPGRADRAGAARRGDGTLQRPPRPHGLRFGPDPSTQNRCTIGGMIGNNACGPHAVAYGRTADNVRVARRGRRHGRRFTAGPRTVFAAVPGLARWSSAEPGDASGPSSADSAGRCRATRWSTCCRRTGAPGQGLVGTEGTCGVLLEATVDLVPVPRPPTLVVLGYPDMPTAADAVPALLAHRPLAIEGMDARLVDVVRRTRARDRARAARGRRLAVRRGGRRHPGGGATRPREALAADAGTTAVADPARRSGGAPRCGGSGRTARARPAGRRRARRPGRAGRTPRCRPERLGAYLREFDALMAAHGVDGLPYGHFGDGCIHVRIDLPLADAPAAVARRSCTTPRAGRLARRIAVR